MIQESPSFPQLERPGRLNEALLRRGAKAITTDATGSINLVMLIDEMASMGMILSSCELNGMGLYKATFILHGELHGDQPREALATAASRESAIADAAIAALQVDNNR
jgi:hypothetical protein